MRALLDVVESCMTTPMIMAKVPDPKAPFRPNKSFSGAAASEPTSSPTLIMDVMIAKLAGEIS